MEDSGGSGGGGVVYVCVCGGVTEKREGAGGGD